MVRRDSGTCPLHFHYSLLKCSRALGVTGVAVSTNISRPFRPSRQTSAATSWVISDTWSSSRTCSRMQFLARKRRKRGGPADKVPRSPLAQCPRAPACYHLGCSPKPFWDFGVTPMPASHHPPPQPQGKTYQVMPGPVPHSQRPQPPGPEGVANSDQSSAGSGY